MLLLRWVSAAHPGDASPANKAFFTVLPRMEREAEGGGRLVARVLGVSVDMGLLEKAVRAERLTPVLDTAASGSSSPQAPRVRFIPGREALQLPPHFFETGLDPADLAAIFGRPPLAVPALGSFADSPLWAGLPQLDAATARALGPPLQRHLAAAAAAAGQNAAAAKSLQVLAAFGRLATQQQAADDAATEAGELAKDNGPRLPAFETLPVWLTRDGLCVPASSLRWPDEDFVSDDIFSICVC